MRMKILAVVTTVALATACAGQDAETKAIIALGVACDNYAAALEQLTPRKASMNPSTVQKINDANAQVDPLCMKGSAADPVTAISTVSQAVGLLRGLNTKE